MRPHTAAATALRVGVRAERAPARRTEGGAQALQDLALLPLHRYAHDIFLARIWALRQNLTAYDAAYVALAEGLDPPLVTRCGRSRRW